MCDVSYHFTVGFSSHTINVGTTWFNGRYIHSVINCYYLACNYRLWCIITYQFFFFFCIKYSTGWILRFIFVYLILFQTRIKLDLTTKLNYIFKLNSFSCRINSNLFTNFLIITHSFLISNGYHDYFFFNQFTIL